MNPQTADLALPVLNAVMTCVALFLAGCGILFAIGSPVPAFVAKAVGRATPGNLGAIRMLAAGILLLNACWEDLGSSAAIPAELIRPMGVLQWFYALVPGLTDLARNEAGLDVYRWIVIAVLALAMLGCATRITLPVAALLYLVFGGLLRQYCWLFHTCLVPLGILIVLCFTPCGDAWSVDRWWRIKRALAVPSLDESAQAASWGRYLCWILVALSYTTAGLSKLRLSGWDWCDATNFRNIAYKDSLQSMEFQFSGGLLLVDWPDWAVEAMALVALAGEVFFVLVLFWPLARRVFPPLMFAMHLGTLLLQNVLFFDMLLLQLIFYDQFGRTSREAAAGANAAGGRGEGFRAACACGLAGVLLLTWVGRIEYYPLTAMQIYSSRKNEPVIRYALVFADYANGRRGRAPIERCLPAMRDGRYRAAATASSNNGNLGLVAQFFESCAKRYNDERPPDQRIVGFEVKHRIWNFQEAPHDPQHGQNTLSVYFDVTRSKNKIRITRSPTAPEAATPAPADEPGP